jgi:CheY-like chemotaxis protein
MSSLLVIDDDTHMLSSLSDALIQAGYDVTAASSGQEALDMARNTVFDLVISDVRMAGMDGIECIERLRSERSELKSIVITGYASDDVPARAMDLASCDYLCKPFTADQLILSVSRALLVLEPVSADSFPAAMREAGLALNNLEATRTRAFQNFYLGVRSGHLGAAVARAVWDHLESVELRRLELIRQLQLRLEVTELTDLYLSITESCKSPAESGVMDHKRLKPGITRVAFQPLFKNIRDGAISCEQLKRSVEARDKIQSLSSESVEDQELYAQIWT